jgi:hypothetical protein
METVPAWLRALLQVLPLGIRGKIYKDVLSSSNGTVFLKRSPTITPNIAFMHGVPVPMETYMGNALNIEPLKYDGWSLSAHPGVLGSLPDGITSNVRSMSFRFNMLRAGL